MPSTLTALETLFESLPELDAVQTLLIFGLVPIALFLLVSWCYQSKLTKKRSSGRQVKFIYAMGHVVHKYAGVITLLSILWAIVLAILQSVYVYHHLTVGTDINYYLQVNSPEYEGVSNIDDAQNLNSLNIILMNYGDTDTVYDAGLTKMLRLHREQQEMMREQQQQEEAQKLSYTATIGIHGDLKFETQDTLLSIMAKRAMDVQQPFRRDTKQLATENTKKQDLSVKTVKELIKSLSKNQNKEFNEPSLQTSTTQSFSIVYHTDNWDNMLTADNLVNICRTEQKLIQQMTCINFDKYKSMIPTIFDLSTCTYFTSFEDSLYKFGLSENSPYVEDGISATYPRSDILISFFKTGTCTDYSEDQLVSMFDKVEVDNVEITYVSQDFVQLEFDAAIFDALYYSAVTIIFCAGFMLLSVRGLIVTMITLFCIIISIVHASAILPYWDYGSFSAFNVLSIFILIGE
jgi:hypothetical protein